MHQSSGVAVAATATNVRLLPLDGDDATVAQRIPLGRLGLPRKLGSAALFLASDASSFVTGIDLRIDGGVSLL